MAQETFMSMLKDIINKLEDGTILNNGKKLSYSTIKSYKGVYNTMTGYNFDFNLDDLDLNSISDRRSRVRVKKKLQGHVNKYLNMLQEDCKHPNTRRSHLKTVRTTLKKIEEEYGYWFPKLQSMKSVQGEVIAMSPEQVELIHTCMPIDPKLHDTWYYTRLMLISCMRISDLVKFECDVNGDAVTIITTKGMGAISTFYLPPDIKDFVTSNTYEYTPKAFRHNLKSLLKNYDEFNKTKIVYDFDHEGHPKKEEKFLWELYTPHKLRSSGITYHLSKGLSEFEVRQISGHSNGSVAFFRYVKHIEANSIDKQKKALTEIYPGLEKNVNMLITN